MSATQAQLARNAFGRAGGVRSGRGGGAPLAGLVSCARCGRRLHGVHAGRKPRPVYRCDNPDLPLGGKGCITFGGPPAEGLVVDAVLDAVAPLAIEAAVEAQATVSRAAEDRRSVLALELSQARYEASLAGRRYASRDPENRLIAAELERRRDEALGRVRAFERRPEQNVGSDDPVDPGQPEGPARDLQSAWTAPGTSMRQRQRLVRTLIGDIIADVEEATGEIVLVIHWKGGGTRTSGHLRTRKPKSPTRTSVSGTAYRPALPPNHPDGTLNGQLGGGAGQ